MSPTTRQRTSAVQTGDTFAAERWRDRSLPDGERLLEYLKTRVGETVCLRELRSRLGCENIRGRVDDLRQAGYQIDGAGGVFRSEALPLCACDGLPWRCRGSQLYRLNAVFPGEPRLKAHGGSWSRDNWNRLVVRGHENVSREYTDVERAWIHRRIREAILRAEREIARKRRGR